MIWVRISDLPIEYYEKHTLWEVGNIIGRTLRVDIHTIKEPTGTNGLGETARGKFARICVEVNLKMTLVPVVRVRKSLYKVEYEGLPLICFGCGKYGHHQEAYPDRVSSRSDRSVPAESRSGGSNTAAKGAVTPGMPSESQSENFDTWMIARNSKR